MAAVATANDEKVQCDCPRFHNGLVSIRTRRRHRKEAGIRGQFQLDTLRNDGFPPENDSLGPQITATTIPEEADHGHVPPVHDFDDWSMDINGEGDGGFFGDQRASEDEEDSNGRDEEDIEDLLQILTIDSGEESAFEDEDEDEDKEENANNELEDLEDRMDDRTDDEEAASLRLLLLELKELSGIDHQGFKKLIHDSDEAIP